MSEVINVDIHFGIRNNNTHTQLLFEINNFSMFMSIFAGKPHSNSTEVKNILRGNVLK